MIIENIKRFIKRYFYNTDVIEETIDSLGGGLLGIGERDTDFVFGAEVDLEKELTERGIINRQVVYEYNQGAQHKTRNWCTIYSAITEISWLMDYEFTLEDIYSIGDRMIRDEKLDPNNGAFLHDAIDYSRRRWNETFPDKQLESYRIKYSDKKLRDILTHKIPRLTQLGYRTSTEMFQEIQTTGIANRKNYIRNGGHAISQWGLTSINNYFEKVFTSGKVYKNRFSFTYMDDLIKNKVIYDIGYMFLKVRA